jgi:hypothetical protein
MVEFCRYFEAWTWGPLMYTPELLGESSISFCESLKGTGCDVAVSRSAEISQDLKLSCTFVVKQFCSSNAHRKVNEYTLKTEINFSFALMLSNFFFDLSGKM